MSEFQDWCNKPEVVLTGTGWGVRISGCDVFDPINQHGVKSFRSFDVVKGLASKEDAESFLANWLKEQIPDYDALAAENERLRTALKDPEAVLVNMLRGDIAIPSVRSWSKLFGEVLNDEDARLLEIATLRAQIAERDAAMAAQASSTTPQ